MAARIMAEVPADLRNRLDRALIDARTPDQPNPTMRDVVAGLVVDLLDDPSTDERVRHCAELGREVGRAE